MIPVWLDASGSRYPICPCSTCGHETPLRRFRFDHLRMIGWKPLGTVQIVEWCGHGQEFVPVPDTDGHWRLIVVEGDAH